MRRRRFIRTVLLCSLTLIGVNFEEKTYIIYATFAIFAVLIAWLNLCVLLALYTRRLSSLRGDGSVK